MRLGWFGYLKALFKGKKVIEEAIAAGGNAKEALEKSSWKSGEFLFAVVSGLGAITAQAAGILPEPYGPIIASSSAALYAISRGMAKRDDPMGGVKPSMSTTEMVANIAASLGAVASASAGACSPEVAAILVAVGNAAVGISRGLAKGGVQPNN